MKKDEMIVVGGGGGFIGGNLIADLLKRGFTNIRSVDIKPFDEWDQRFEGVDNLQLDLKDKANCYTACDGADYVYQLAADMGGMGFIENNKAPAATPASSVSSIHPRPASTTRRSRRARTSSPSRKRMPIRLTPRTATAGRSFSRSACAGTSAKITAS
jgi:uncharacterized protein YbjT (DUF2867 family)